MAGIDQPIQYPPREEYYVGQILALTVLPNSVIHVRVTKLHTQTFSYTMVVDILDESLQKGTKAFLKLADRRFATGIRENFRINPWSKEIEEAYHESIENGSIYPFLHDAHTIKNFYWDTGDDWDAAQDEAYVADQLVENHETEVAVYHALRAYQGRQIPKFLAAVGLELAPLPVAQSESDEEDTVAEMLDEQAADEQSPGRMSVEETTIQEATVEEKPVEESTIEDLAIKDPIVEEPMIGAPTLEEPATKEPSIREPAVEKPATGETVIEALNIQQSIAEDPFQEEQTLDESSIEEPFIRELAVQKPAIDETFIKEPNVQESIVEDPIVKDPIAEVPTAEDLAIREPAVEESVIEGPSVNSLAIDVPVIEEPAIQTTAVDETIAEKSSARDANADGPTVALEDTTVEETATEKPTAEASTGEQQTGMEATNEEKKPEKPLAQETTSAERFQPLKIKGILLEYIDGHDMYGLCDHFPQSSWEDLVERAIKTIDMLDEYDIVNSDVKPNNFLITTTTGDCPETQKYQVYMIDFGLCRFRRKGETDTEWGQAKCKADEEGGVVRWMDKMMKEKYSYKLAREQTWRWDDYAEKEEDMPPEFWEN